MKLLNIIILFLSLIGMIHAGGKKNNCSQGDQSCTNARDCEQEPLSSCVNGCCEYNGAS